MAQISELDWPLEVVSEGHGFAEGASLGPDGKIYFSDMDKQKILSFDPASGTTSVWQEESGKTNGLFILGSKLFGCEAGGRAVVEYDLDKGPGSRKELASTFQGDKLGCPNDITVTDEVFKMLDESSSLFRTLVIKTNCTLPYTSVFLQLDCAYWGPENEQMLRQKMSEPKL